MGFEISAAHVGRVLARTDVVVTFRESAAYAAGMGSDREAYLDDRTAGGARVPPWFVATLEWPLVSGASALERLAVPPGELFRSVLHAFQDTRFDRPIRIGDRLRAEAVLASVRATASGVLVIVRIATTEAASGASIALSWFGAFFRGATAGESRVGFETPAVHAGDAASFATLGEMSISRAQSHVYGECARLWNPIHTEPLFAASANLRDIAFHGTLLWAKAGELYADRYLDGDAHRVRRLYARFRRPVHPGRRLVVRSARLPGAVTAAAVDICDGDDILVSGVAETDTEA